MRVSILGLGYVGAVTAGCLARDGHDVLGCDLDHAKLDLIGEGQTPIIERGMKELMSGAVASGRLQVTDDPMRAVQDSEISFVCVGTPGMANGGQDLTAVQRVSEQLGEALKAKPGFHLLVFRSTVLPGTMERVVLPAVESSSGLRGGVDFGLCFQPEFLREGSSIDDYDNPPFTVVGIDCERSAHMLKEVFGHLPCDFVTTDVGTAELLKYCCNAFHALKITFANEIGRIAQALNVDPHAAMALVCRDERLNISPAYLKPGFAFGGSCLPKDLKALLYAARREDVDIPMLAGILPSNAIHIDAAIRMVLESGRKSVGMIGLSFKSGTDDLRESPLVILAERFIGKGLDLQIHDPEVNLARLVGANRRYIEESVPHIASLMKPTCEEIVRTSDVLVVGLRDDHLMDCVYEHTREDQIVLDLVNIPERSRVKGTYHGVCW